MARFLGLTQVPIFVEAGDAKITTEYGKNIKDYPTTGKTGDHWGLDIVRSTDGKTSTTATVCAIADGIITAQRKYVQEYDDNGKRIYSPSDGNCVYILHDDGLTITKYFHLKQGTVPDWVEDNVRVKKGQVIGYMGNTGYSYGSHVHFQVEKLASRPEKIDYKLTGPTVNPEPYLTGEIIIGKSIEYFVKIGTFLSKEEAENYQKALKLLGTSSTIEKV